MLPISPSPSPLIRALSPAMPISVSGHGQDGEKNGGISYFIIFVLVPFLKVMNEPSIPSDIPAPACFPQQYKSSLPELSVCLLDMIAGGEGMYQWGKYYSSNIVPVPPKPSPVLWTRPHWHFGTVLILWHVKCANTARKPFYGCLCDTSHPRNALLGSMGSLIGLLRYGKRKEKNNVNEHSWERSLRRNCASAENITTFTLLIIFFWGGGGHLEAVWYLGFARAQCSNEGQG